MSSNLAGQRQIARGLALLRIVVGAVFLAHGVQKLLVFGPAGVAEAFTRMAVPIPQVTSVVVMVVELFAGLALALGYLTRLAAALLAVDMASAIVLVRLRGGFFLPGGTEYELVLLAALLALLLAGPGALALDSRIRRRGGPRI